MNLVISRKRGRPPGWKPKNPVNRMLPVKVTEDKLAEYKEAAKRKEMTFSDWARNALDNAIEADQ